MCGLLGYSGTVPYSIDNLKMLLLYNETRGGDAAGIYALSGKSGKREIFKRAGNTYIDFIPAMNISPDTLAIGHLRYATQGSYKTDKNAHPFQYGPIIGAHNGTIDNWRLLAEKYDIPKSDIEVDSQIIFLLLSKPEVGTGVLKHYTGKAAIIYTDEREPESLYCYRDFDKPLFRGVIKTESGQGMYLSSLKESLLAIGCTNVKEFKEGCLYKITGGTVKEHVKITREPIYSPYHKDHTDNKKYDKDYYNSKKNYWERNNTSCSASHEDATMDDYEYPDNSYSGTAANRNPDDYEEERDKYFAMMNNILLNMEVAMEALAKTGQFTQEKALEARDILKTSMLETEQCMMSLYETEVH